MTDSGLIVFLPLVGAILGAVVGAFGGAWANKWYRDRESKKAENRERDALLVLLSLEVKQNNLVLDSFIENLDDHPNDDARCDVAEGLQTEVWEASRVRLAQLLDSRRIAELAYYYTAIGSLRQDWRAPNQELNAERDMVYARSNAEIGGLIIEIVQVDISDPEIATKLLTKDESGPTEDSKEADPT